MTLTPEEAYQRAAAIFGQMVVGLNDLEWDLQCGPDHLTIAQAVAWVAVGDSQVTAAIRSGRLDDIAEIDASVLGPNLVATWRGTAVAVLNELEAPGAVHSTVNHSDGRISVLDIVGQRVTENLVRAWDIGVATARPVSIPDDLADWCIEFWATHADAVMAGGVLPGSPILPPDGAGPVVRLLAFTGRTVNTD